MPRLIDLKKELADLAKADPDARRQFVLRLETPAATKMIEQCLARNDQPGPVLEKIVTDHYLNLDKGVVVELPAKTATFLDLIATARGSTREAVAASILNAHVVAAYKEELAEAAEVEELMMRQSLKQARQTQPKPTSDPAAE